MANLRNLRKDHRILIIPHENHIIESLPIGYSIFTQLEGARIFYIIPQDKSELFRKFAWIDQFFLYDSNKKEVFDNDFLELITFEYVFILTIKEKYNLKRISLNTPKKIFLKKKYSFFPGIKSKIQSANYYRYLSLLKNIGLTKKYQLPPIIGYHNTQFFSKKKEDNSINNSKEQKKENNSKKSKNETSKNQPRSIKPKILWIIDDQMIKNVDLFDFLHKITRGGKNIALLVNINKKDKSKYSLINDIIKKKKFQKVHSVDNKNSHLDQMINILYEADLVISWNSLQLHLASLLQKIHFGLYDKDTPIHENRTLPLENHSIYYADYLIHPSSENKNEIQKKLSDLIVYLSEILL